MKLPLDKIRAIDYAFYHNLPVNATDRIPLTKPFAEFKELILKTNPKAKLFLTPNVTTLVITDVDTKDWNKKQFNICEKALVIIKDDGSFVIEGYTSSYTICLISELREALDVEHIVLDLELMVRESKLKLLKGGNPILTLRATYPDSIVKAILFEIFGISFTNANMRDRTYTHYDLREFKHTYSNTCGNHQITTIYEDQRFLILLEEIDRLEIGELPIVYWKSFIASTQYGFSAENLLYILLLIHEKSLADFLTAGEEFLSSPKEHIRKVLTNLNLEAAKLLCELNAGVELDMQAVDALSNVITEFNNIVY